jgi:hypothetical protein
MIGPISRIILRYLAAALVTYGLVPVDVGAQIAMDPDLIAMLGLTLAALVELIYNLAKRRGWAT